jgi:hypothetical protein
MNGTGLLLSEDVQLLGCEHSSFTNRNAELLDISGCFKLQILLCGYLDAY